MGQKNSAISIHHPKPGFGRFSPFKPSTSGAEIQREVPIDSDSDSFTLPEEKALRASSARLLAMAFAPEPGTQGPVASTIANGLPNEAPVFSSPLFGARSSLIRPCPSPPALPTAKRQITSWHNGASRLAAETASSPPPSQLTGVQRHPSTRYNATIGRTGSVDPMDLASWDVAALAKDMAPFTMGSSFQTQPPSGTQATLVPSYRYAAPNLLSHYSPLGLPNNSLPHGPSRGLPLTIPSPPHLLLSPDTEAVPAPVSDCYVPIYSTNQVLSLPLPPTSPIFISEHQLNMELKVNRSNVTWENWEHQIILFELLGPNAPAHLILTLLRMPRRVITERLEYVDPLWYKLSDVSFKKARSVATIIRRWGHLTDTCEAIMKFAEDSGLDLYSSEYDNAEVFVNKIIATWRDRFPNGGSWGTVDKLKLEDVAAWTYDPKNGWLAMMYRRLRESGVVLPSMKPPVLPDLGPLPRALDSLQSNRGGQAHSESALYRLFSDAEGPLPRSHVSASAPIYGVRRLASPPHPPPPSEVLSISRQPDNPAHQAQPTEAGRSSITPDDPFAETDEPSRVSEGYPCRMEMLRQHDAVTNAQISLADMRYELLRSQSLQAKAETDKANAEADKAKAEADKTRTDNLKSQADILDRLLDRAYGHRTQALQEAMQYIHHPQINAELRRHIQGWVSRVYYTTDPSDDVTRFIAEWTRTVELGLATHTESNQVQAVPTAPIPPFSLSNL